MTKIRDSVIPRSKLTAHMPPGAATPRSGIYEQVGPRSGTKIEQADSTRGKPLLPAVRSGGGWKLVGPMHHTSKEQV
jgi:hypothetical protein